MDKLLTALRTRTNDLFELVFPEENKPHLESDSLVDNFRLTEEYTLKDRRKIRITEDEDRQQLVYVEGLKRLILYRAAAGYRVEVSLLPGYTVNRHLTDGTTHQPVSDREREVLSWAFESIKWLIANISSIVGIE